MKKQHHVIYVPGIADNVYHIQSLSVKTWRLWGVRGHCHVMPWAGTEAYEPKFQRLIDQIAAYTDAGHRVSLVGASAGASAVLNAYAQRPDKITAVVLICPKINHPETVGQEVFATNPAFRQSLQQLQLSLQSLTVASKHRIITYYSPKDGVVPFDDIHIVGVTEHALPSLRHGYAIVYGLTLGARRLLGNVKREAIN